MHLNAYQILALLILGLGILLVAVSHRGKLQLTNSSAFTEHDHSHKLYTTHNLGILALLLGVILLLMS